MFKSRTKLFHSSNNILSVFNCSVPYKRTQQFNAHNLKKDIIISKQASMLKQTRQALHAGSWYSNNPNELNTQLGSYLKKAKKQLEPKQVKAIIGPHAGYYYCGPTSAWSYQYVTKPHNIKTVFLLGPSHHKYFPGCTLTYMDQYATPFGPLSVDTEIVDKLKEEEGFHMIDIDDEEDEHSLEMHLPFIAKTLGRDVKIVPIMTGPVNEEMADNYGKIFAPYFDNPNTMFIFSSDFCHWGERFGFTYYREEDGQIWQSIEKLDGEGMNAIQSHSYKEFQKHISSTKNTICGRHPISIFLKTLSHSKITEHLKTKFVKYAQSEQVKDPSKSSVSYATSITYLEQ